ncbi:MAG TPA: SH3 domain-containing protein [Firmicutes bacterium]|nr:SH3 domain-containing protein [Bacillota bacterium]
MYLQRMVSVLCIAATVSGFGAEAALAASKGIVTGSGVNLRDAAGTSGTVIGAADEGQEVEILSSSNGWYQVDIEGLGTAYISSDYVQVAGQVGTVTGSNVNVRSGADTGSSVVGTVNQGDTVTITSESGDWYCIRRLNGDTAYVSKQYVSCENPSVTTASAFSQVQNTYAMVTSPTGLHLRSSASTSSNSKGVLEYNEVMNVLESNGSWLKVKTVDGVEGYVSAEFVVTRNGEMPSRSSSGSAKGEQIVAYAEQFIGTPYSWAGTSLTSGVDCSGFVYSVMKEFGISLNRSSSSMASNGVAVDRSQLQPGDLVFFDTTNATNQGYISHVGIYMGNGKIIHSSSGSAWGVTINSLSEPYYDMRYVTARRVIR